jgi:hypothetical protein
MKLILTIIILNTLIACSNQVSVINNTVEELSPKLMVGEWRLDSSSNRHLFNDKLIILENFKTFEFSGTDGGSLRAKGSIVNDTLTSEVGEKVKIELLDSNKIRISGGWNNADDYFRRSNYGDNQENLLEYLRQDSLRKKVIGWWQLTESKMPVRLINYSGYYEKLTLSIQRDGNAVFYLENQFDSIVNYSYRMNSDGIDFNRGCIAGSDSKISFDNFGNMRLVLDRRFGDTLTLVRLSNIKK